MSVWGGGGGCLSDLQAPSGARCKGGMNLQIKHILNKCKERDLVEGLV